MFLRPLGRAPERRVGEYRYYDHPDRAEQAREEHWCEKSRWASLTGSFDRVTGPRSASGAAYGEFSSAPSREELELFFFLDDADKARVATRRSATSRLGFTLQLGTVRFLGVFLNEPTRVPGQVVDYVAEQVGAPSSALEGYLERRPTRFRHTAEITEEYGYREFAAVEKELVHWLADRAWTTDEGSAALFDGAVVWLRSRLVLLPGLTTLTRLVGRERDGASARGWSELVAPLSTAQERALGLLLAAMNALPGLLDLRATRND